MVYLWKRRLAPPIVDTLFETCTNIIIASIEKKKLNLIDGVLRYLTKRSIFLCSIENQIFPTTNIELRYL